MGDIAYIPAPVDCDFCQMTGAQVKAEFDGATIHGPWAYMCNEHFAAYGVGLGTGRGQKLIVGERPKDKPYTDDDDMDEGEIPPIESTKPPKNGTPVEMDWGQS